MKKYIGIEGNRLRMKAEMKEPNKGDYIYPERARDPSFYGIRYEKAMKDYEAHLASLPVIPAEFEVEIDREYVELVDFKKVLKIKNDITGPTISDNSGFVALPISKQEASPEVSKEGKHFSVIEISGVVTGVGYEEKIQGGIYSESICETLYDDAEESKKWAQRICDALNRATPSPSPTIKSAEAVLKWIPFENHKDFDEPVYEKSEVLKAMNEYASQFRDSKPSK